MGGLVLVGRCRWGGAGGMSRGTVVVCWDLRSMVGWFVFGRACVAGCERGSRGSMQICTRVDEVACTLLSQSGLCMVSQTIRYICGMVSWEVNTPVMWCRLGHVCYKVVTNY